MTTIDIDKAAKIAAIKLVDVSFPLFTDDQKQIAINGFTNIIVDKFTDQLINNR